MLHTFTHIDKATPLLRFKRVCLCGCALHNAGVKVSGLIFYLSGLITIAFTAALLGSVEDTASLLNLYWARNKRKKKKPEKGEGEKKEAACLQSIQGSHKNATAADAPACQGVLQHPAFV